MLRQFRGIGALAATRRLVAMSLALYASVLVACAPIITRAPIPEAEIRAAKPYGINERVRAWGDTIDKFDLSGFVEQYAERQRRHYTREIAAGGPIGQNYLALSGGGPDGAFGAGLLAGWTKRGDRPEFDIVTGISTGAIIAVFAFLGPDYDDTLKEIYTTYKTDQLLSTTIFSLLTGGISATDASGYRNLIEKYIDDEVVRRIAEEHRKGRGLLVATTNLDAARPVIWGVSAIAASGHPDAKRLIHDVIQASSAIPVAFPPVLIPVQATDGKIYDEMHVDGGATQQVTLFSPELPLQMVDRTLGVRFDRTIYVIINNKLRKPYAPVRPRAIPIAQAAASSLIGGSGGSDIYKIFAIAQRDGMGLNVASIPRDFDAEASEPFDPVYMSELYGLGYELGLAGEHWLPRPRDFAPWPPETSAEREKIAAAGG